MPRPSAITAAAQETILTFLPPLFLSSPPGDMAAAHEAARDTLASDGVRRPATTDHPAQPSRLPEQEDASGRAHAASRMPDGRTRYGAGRRVVSSAFSGSS